MTTLAKKKTKGTSSADVIKKLVAENADLRECLERSRRVGQIAMRDATQAHIFGEAVSLGAACAGHFLQAGMLDITTRILNAIRTAQIDNLRNKVSNEPGGVAYEAAKRTAEPSGPPQTEKKQ